VRVGEVGDDAFELGGKARPPVPRECQVGISLGYYSSPHRCGNAWKSSAIRHLHLFISLSAKDLDFIS